MEEYSYILGFLSAKQFLSMCLFATIGIIISLLIDAQTRDQSSTRTPVRFSWWFLLKDNWKSILLTALIVLMTLRFVTSFFLINL
jgi:cytochrome c biogenesis protein CcdA